MTNETTGGISKRSLLLLGGLAALALNRDTRRAVVGGTKNVWHGAQGTLDDRVKPALSLAAAQAQQAAHEAARLGAATYGQLREEAPQRAQSLLGGVMSSASELAHSAQERAAALKEEAQSLSAQQAKEARKALKKARKTAGRTLDQRVKPALAQAQDLGLGLLAEAQDKVQGVLGEGLDTVEGKKRHAERSLSRARRDAERELRAARKHWNPKKLEKAVSKKVAPLQKELGRELKVLEKQARLARRDDRRGGVGGSLTTVALVGAGAAVLARNPGVRQNILNAVDTVSPDAAKALHQAGKKVRGVVGSVWLEREEPTNHDVAADRPTTPSPSVQADLTGKTDDAAQPNTN